MKYEILSLFVNTLTTDDKYSSRNIQNLTQQLQTTMSQKKKKLSIEFLLHMSNLEEVPDDFVKKDESTSLSIYDIIDAEKSGYLNV